MRLVHHARQAELSARVIHRVLAVLAVLAVLGGCGGSHSDNAANKPGATIGIPVRTVTCTDWRAATVEQRRGTVRAIRHFSGGAVGSPAGHGAVLPDDRAYTLFERYCAQSFAAHFKIYKLYTRAAAFTPQPAQPAFGPGK